MQRCRAVSQVTGGWVDRKVTQSLVVWGDDGYGQFRIPSEQPSAVASQPPGQQGLAGLWRSTLEQEIPYCVWRTEIAQIRCYVRKPCLYLTLKLRLSGYQGQLEDPKVHI